MAHVLLDGELVDRGRLAHERYHHAALPAALVAASGLFDMKAVGRAGSRVVRPGVAPAAAGAPHDDAHVVMQDFHQGMSIVVTHRSLSTR